MFAQLSISRLLPLPLIPSPFPLLFPVLVVYPSILRFFLVRVDLVLFVRSPPPQLSLPFLLFVDLTNTYTAVYFIFCLMNCHITDIYMRINNIIRIIIYLN